MIEQLFWLSTLMALGLAIFHSVRQRMARPLLWTLLGLGIVLPLLVRSGAVSSPWASRIQVRGVNDVNELQPTLVVTLYLVMVLGMLAHYGYERFQRPKGKRRKLDGGALLAPVFVSPIVFLPLASILGSTEPSQASASRLMLLLVAFENGFFWRDFFSNRIRARTEGGEP